MSGRIPQPQAALSGWPPEFPMLGTKHGWAAAHSVISDRFTWLFLPFKI